MDNYFVSRGEGQISFPRNYGGAYRAGAPASEVGRLGSRWIRGISARKTMQEEGTGDRRIYPGKSIDMKRM